VECGAHQLLVDRLQLGLPADDDVGRVLYLNHARSIRLLEPSDRWTVQSRIGVHLIMKKAGIGFIRKLLGRLPVRDTREWVVEHSEFDAGFA
jgi:hypothetical protein